MGKEVEAKISRLGLSAPVCGGARRWCGLGGARNESDGGWYGVPVDVGGEKKDAKRRTKEVWGGLVDSELDGL